VIRWRHLEPGERCPVCQHEGAECRVGLDVDGSYADCWRVPSGTTTDNGSGWLHELPQKTNPPDGDESR
jgi:hypothetical protein